MVNKSLILEELKRINFIINYEVGNLVSENESKKENILFEQKVNNLFEPKKGVINEEEKDFFKSMTNVVQKGISTAAAQAKWTRETDPIGYWKILFENLTKAGVPVKWQVANDPVKSSYMYWGPWVINKLGDYNITLSTPKKNILYFKFRNYGGKYVGQQNLKDIQLDSECINLYFLASEVFKKDINQLLSYFYTNWQGNVRNGSSCMGKKSAIDGEMRLLVKTSVTTSWETELGNYIKKYLPAGAKFVDGTSGKQITYGTTGLMLNFTKNGWVEFPENGDKNKVPISYGKWYWDEKTKSPIVNASFASFMDVPSLIKDPYTKLIKPDLEKKKKDYEKQNKEIERKADLVYTNLVKAFDYDNDGVDDDWDGTDEDLTAKTIEMIDSREVLELLNKKIKARGYYSDITAWFKAEMDRISIDSNEYDRVVNKLNSLGYKLDKASWLGYLASYTVGIPIKAVDQTVTNIQNTTNYANKQTQGAVAKYSGIQILQILNKEVNPPIDLIAQALLNASTFFQDDEKIIEKAFSRIHTKERYNELKKIMGKDPYQFVKGFVNTYMTYGKEGLSVDGSYNAIFGDPNKITKLPGTYKKLPDGTTQFGYDTKFSVDNADGTTQTFNGEPLFFKIAEGKAKDPYNQNGVAIVPKGFLWDYNTSLYPTPVKYSTELITQFNLGRQFYEDRKFEGKAGDLWTDYIKTEEELLKFKTADIMSKWNSDLANQATMIPKYCTKFYKYQPTATEKKLVGGYGGGVYEKEEKTSEGVDISMAAYCRDFGGLWVYNSTSGYPECGCRDKNNVFLSGNLKVIDKKSGKEGVININKGFSSDYNIDWNSPVVWEKITGWVLDGVSLLASMLFPAISPLVGVMIGVSKATYALMKENPTEAAIYLLFEILPGIGKTVTAFKGLTISAAERLAQKVATGVAEKGLEYAEVKILNNIINYQDIVTNYVENLAETGLKNGTISQTTKGIVTASVKKAESSFWDAVGAQGTDPKSLSKTVAQEVDKKINS